jgi:bifunctional DNA-binding transcriptional regulator/antitoxin component of YhaV-PrlF toxin-antitoxin module
MKTLELDAKGRIAIPEDLQEELGIVPGDRLVYVVDCGVLLVSIADTPLEDVIVEAEAEYRAGKTISAEEYARQRGFELDDATIDQIVEEALTDHRAGRTISAEQLAIELGVSLDNV